MLHFITRGDGSLSSLEVSDKQSIDEERVKELNLRAMPQGSRSEAKNSMSGAIMNPLS